MSEVESPKLIEAAQMKSLFESSLEDPSFLPFLKSEVRKMQDLIGELDTPSTLPKFLRERAEKAIKEGHALPQPNDALTGIKRLRWVDISSYFLFEDDSFENVVDINKDFEPQKENLLEGKPVDLSLRLFAYDYFMVRMAIDQLKKELPESFTPHIDEYASQLVLCRSTSFSGNPYGGYSAVEIQGKKNIQIINLDDTGIDEEFNENFQVRFIFTAHEIAHHFADYFTAASRDLKNAEQLMSNSKDYFIFKGTTHTDVIGLLGETVAMFTESVIARKIQGGLETLERIRNRELDNPMFVHGDAMPIAKLLVSQGYSLKDIPALIMHLREELDQEKIDVYDAKKRGNEKQSEEYYRAVKLITDAVKKMDFVKGK